jgi:hypothetical protein
MKLQLRWGLVVSVLMLAQPAEAVTIFFDDFNRTPAANTVGNNWIETETDAPAVRVDTNTLLMAGNGNAPRYATQGNAILSTIGLTNITLDYQWSSAGAETGDFLNVYWSPDGTSFTQLASHALSNTSLVSASWSLGAAAANLADISIRFELVANMGGDTARVDNVHVQGVAAAPAPVPINPSLAAQLLAGFGILVLGLSRRNRKQAEAA